jgi:valyl-tRNA synthetase
MTLPKAYDPKGVEDRWYSFWEERGYLHGRVRPEKPSYSIVIPPPNVTGELHMGHALNNILQDVMIRYKRMDGYEACWFPGTDHASIAVHVLIERGLHSRELDDLLQQIGYSVPADDRPLTRHDLGREVFIRLGWAWREKYGDRIRKQLKALGCSCDWERERFTLDEGFSRAVLEVFVRLYNEGSIYRGERLINWCPRCQTALSDLEVEYEELEGTLYHIKYPVEGSDEALVIATTRPETMLADTAVAVHPEDERYKRFVGKHVILPLMGRKIPIIADEAVDPEFGTGALKVTPGHDPTDFEIGERRGLEIISIFHPDGTCNENAGRYQGLDRFECRGRVVEDLKREGLLLKEEPYVHSVGHCQRCHTVVEPMISKQWFMRMRGLAAPAIEAVRSGIINFVPERWEKIYFNWMENIRDWCISRQLWWGHRIPAWHCRDCEGITVQLNEPEKCAHCGSADIHQDEDILDTWFSSALWPFGIMGWPEETEELHYFYPTSLLSTGPDIIFFWVARMIMMGLHFLGEIPFRDVYFHPIIVDERGQKMSKSKGNVIDPLEMKERFGIDALRFTLLSFVTKGQEMRLSIGDIEGSRKFLNKIWNATRFALMNLEDFRPQGPELDLREPLERLEDRWMLSRLTRVIEGVRAHLESYDFNVAAKALYEFTWHELCDWYLELIKPRLLGQDPRDQQAAQHVLALALRETLKLLHPLVPFLTEELWQKLPEALRDAESAMIAPFPRPHESWLDEDAEREMGILQELITAIRTIRSEMRVPPGVRPDVIIRTENPEIERLCLNHERFFLDLARVERLVIGPSVERPKSAPRKVLDYAEVFVPLEGLIDLDAQRKRLERELEDARRELERIRRRLDNEEFLAKAPQEIIEKEKTRDVELRAMIERLEENLSLMGAGSSS